MALSLDTLLAFVDECDLSDGELPHHLQWQPISRRPRRPSCESTASSSEMAAPKTRLRPDVVEIARLQEVVASLEQQLRLLKGARVGHSQHQSPWKITVELQSSRRAAAQRENERLRDRLLTQRKTTKRLAKLIERSSTLQAIRMVRQFERAAAERATMRVHDFDEFDQAFLDTDKVLEAAVLYDLPSSFTAERVHRESGKRGFFIEFRRRQWGSCSLAAASKAYWQFSPLSLLKNVFITIEQSGSILDESMDIKFCMQPTHDLSSFQFRGRYQARKYSADKRVVVVWRASVEPHDQYVESKLPTYLQIRGRGCTVFDSSGSNGEMPTSLRVVSTFYPENPDVDWDQARQDPCAHALIKTVMFVVKCMSNITAEMIQNE